MEYVMEAVPAPVVGITRRTGICLNMIVKDEADMLGRLMRSVLRAIDYFVIVDTGSTDGTPDLLRRISAEWGIPGEVHERPWVNFEHNRQQALELAIASGHADWLLFLDADEELRWSDPSWFAHLQPGVSYRLRKHLGGMRYALPNLVDIRQSRWNWRGPVHEALYCVKGGEDMVTLESAWIHCRPGQGARSHGVTAREKFLRDAALLEAVLAKDPDHARNRFYLAQSYRDAGELPKAFEHYHRRSRMGGWIEEAYVAQCEKGKLAIALGHPHHEVVRIFLDAWAMRPTRAEALWYLARYCRNNKHYAEGFLFAMTGKDIPLPQDVLFVQQAAYEWRLWDELAVNAFWIGRYRTSEEACRHLLSTRMHPPTQTTRIQHNLALAQEKGRS